VRILAIDPGTRCGWALHTGEEILSGTWNLKSDDNPGRRWIGFRKRIRAANPDKIVYEKVMAHAATLAAHMYGGFEATIQAYCAEAGVELDSVHVGTIKKHATGKGNANKAQMVSAAAKRWPEIEIQDDNQADALWLLDYEMTRMDALEGGGEPD